MSKSSKPVRAWSGQGRLQVDGATVPCLYELIQNGDGGVIVSCKAESRGILLARRCRIEGRTDRGEEVTVSGRVTGMKTTTRKGTALTVLGEEYKALAGGGQPASLRYGLTNLDLEGRFSFDGLDVAIRRVDGFREAWEQVKATRGIGVTAEATVSGSPGDPEPSDRVVERLSLLLTLAQGYRVEWIYREALDLQGRVVETYGRDAITKPCGGYQLVPQDEVCDFVARASPLFDAVAGPWGLKKAILSYNDAKLEGDYLEFRALKMAVVVEYLRGLYLRGRPKQPFRVAATGLWASLGVPLTTDDLGLLVQVNGDWNFRWREWVRCAKRAGLSPLRRSRGG